MRWKMHIVQPSLANDPFPSRWSQFSPLWMENSDGSDQHQSLHFPKLSIESVEKSHGTKPKSLLSFDPLMTDNARITIPLYKWTLDQFKLQRDLILFLSELPFAGFETLPDMFYQCWTTEYFFQLFYINYYQWMNDTTVEKQLLVYAKLLEILGQVPLHERYFPIRHKLKTDYLMIKKLWSICPFSL